MKEYPFIFKKGLLAGLRNTDKHPRNEQALILSDGAYPENTSLRAMESISLLPGIEELGESFPYPQVHRGQSHTLVFGATKIWEYKNGSYDLVKSGLTSGGLWTVADFYDYIVATNGSQLVVRNTDDHTWNVVDSEELPKSNCVAAVNGQLIVGSPNKEF